MVCLNSYAFSALDTFILRVSINLCHNENIVPFVFRTVLDHAPKIGTVVICARHGAVNIGIQNKDVVCFGVFLTDADLSFNGLLCLIFGRITRVDSCCFHFDSAFLAFSSYKIFPFGGAKANGNALQVIFLCR